MNRTLVNQFADAILYEGYILYPYRTTVKKRQPGPVGDLYPEVYCQGQGGSAAWSNQTECLVHGSPTTQLEVIARFLHLTARRVREMVPSQKEWSKGAEKQTRPVESLRVGNELYHSWQEAQAREIALPRVTLGELSVRSRPRPFVFLGGCWTELLRGTGGMIVGVLEREQRPIKGVIEAMAVEAAAGLYQVRLHMVNRTPLGASSSDRDEAEMRRLVSAHLALGVREGEFVSLTDPPDCYREAAAACRNDGVWPVLIGSPGATDTMLAAPLMLSDYPQARPQRPDSLIQAEKKALAAVDERAEVLAHEQLPERLPRDWNR